MTRLSIWQRGLLALLTAALLVIPLISIDASSADPPNCPSLQDTADHYSATGLDYKPTGPCAESEEPSQLGPEPDGGTVSGPLAPEEQYDRDGNTLERDLGNGMVQVVEVEGELPADIDTATELHEWLGDTP